MSLVNCPECNHQVSASADACPNCGHPFTPPAVKSKVITHTSTQESFPKWIFIPLGILGLVLVFVLIMFMQNKDETANRDIDVNINPQRQTAERRDTNPPPNDVVIPPSTTTDTTNPPQTIPPDTQTTVIENDSPDKGVVNIEAKVTDTTGKTDPVEKEKFYLLDKQLESILSEANIKSIDGQTLVNTFGLSVLNPGKYSDINKKALEAIEDHVKYDTLSDSSGKAQLKGVEPGSYYLFAIHKTTNGFAIWNSPVTIKPGQNPIVLSPARITEVKQ
jgi:hypothetical protein